MSRSTIIITQLLLTPLIFGLSIYILRHPWQRPSPPPSTFIATWHLAPVIYAKAKPLPPIEVVGIMLGSASQNTAALIKINGQQKTVTLGSEIAQGITVTRIFNDRIVIKQGERSVFIALHSHP